MKRGANVFRAREANSRDEQSPVGIAITASVGVPGRVKSARSRSSHQIFSHRQKICRRSASMSCIPCARARQDEPLACLVRREWPHGSRAAGPERKRSQTWAARSPSPIRSSQDGINFSINRSHSRARLCAKRNSKAPPCLRRLLAFRCGRIALVQLVPAACSALQRCRALRGERRVRLYSMPGSTFVGRCAVTTKLD